MAFIIDFLLLISLSLFVYYIFGVVKTQKQERIRSEKEIFRIAREKGGRVSITDLISESSISSEETEQILKKLVDKGYVGLKVTDSGVMMYEFLETMRNTDGEPSTAAVLADEPPVNRNHGETLTRIFLIGSEQLSNQPRQTGTGKVYIPGTAFETVRKDESGWYEVKVGPETKWLSPRYTTEQDPRVFFSIPEKDITGYLVQMHKDKTDGAIDSIMIIDNDLGGTMIRVKKIQTLKVFAIDEEKGYVVVETSDHHVYTGRLIGEKEGKKTFLVTDDVLIQLDDTKELALKSVKADTDPSAKD